MHMAPHGEGMGNIGGSCSTQQRSVISNVHRTTSDISFQISKAKEAALLSSSVIDEEGEKQNNNTNDQKLKLGSISEVGELEVAKCECCGMSEECTPEYMERVKSKFMGKWVCGLCAEAVKEEKENKAAVSLEEALNIHMNACSRFNKLGRAYPVLFQAEAMREMLKRTTTSGNSSSNRAPALRAAKSFSPRGDPRPVPIARSSSCIPAITNINPSSATSN